MVVNSVVGERITSFMYSKWLYHNLKPYMYATANIYMRTSGEKYPKRKKLFYFRMNPYQVSLNAIC